MKTVQNALYFPANEPAAALKRAPHRRLRSARLVKALRQRLARASAHASVRRSMRPLLRPAIGGLLFFATLGRAASVREPHTPPTELLFHNGLIGVFDQENADNFGSLEIRLPQTWHGVRPWAGLTAADSGTWFAGAGFIYDAAVGDRLRLTLGSGPFYYHRSASPIHDLGFDLEFYSFAEVSFEMAPDTRIGLRLGHLSNAGLGRRNPGTETLSLVLSVPLGRNQK